MIDLDTPNIVKDAIRERNGIILRNLARIESEKRIDKLSLAKNREILATLYELRNSSPKEQFKALIHVEDVCTQYELRGHEFEINESISYIIMNGAKNIHRNYYVKNYDLRFCVDCHHEITLNEVLNYLDCDNEVKQKCKEEIITFRETVYILAGYTEFILYYNSDKDIAIAKIMLLFSEPFSTLVDNSVFKKNTNLAIYSTFKEIYKIYFFLLIYSMVIYPINIDYYKRPIIKLPTPSFLEDTTSTIVEIVNAFRPEFNSQFIDKATLIELSKLRRIALEGLLERLINEITIYDSEYKLKAINYLKKLNEIKYREINKSESVKDYMINISIGVEKYNIEFEQIEHRIMPMKYTKGQECSIISCRKLGFEFWKILTKYEILMYMPPKRS